MHRFTTTSITPALLSLLATVALTGCPGEGEAPSDPTEESQPEAPEEERGDAEAAFDFVPAGDEPELPAPEAEDPNEAPADDVDPEASPDEMSAEGEEDDGGEGDLAEEPCEVSCIERAEEILNRCLELGCDEEACEARAARFGRQCVTEGCGESGVERDPEPEAEEELTCEEMCAAEAREIYAECVEIHEDRPRCSDRAAAFARSCVVERCEGRRRIAEAD